MSQQATAATPAAGATVVVLGAGINGAALARELLLSGVSVAIVDAGDIASGATAWSTRLVHGGLRYLEYGEVGLVRESLVERDRLARLAPHLVRPLGFYLPVETRLGGLGAAGARLLGLESLARRWRGNRGRGSWTVGIGLSLYDLLSVGSRWPWHRLVRAGLSGMPQVDAGRFPFAAVYADAQMLFPERFTVELLVDARRIAAKSAAQFAVFTHHAARLMPDGRLRIEPIGQRGGGAAAVELEPAAIINDARDMRARMAETVPGRNVWDLKHAPGGLVDIEFIAQTLQLVHAQHQPEILNTNTVAALFNLKAAGFLAAADADALITSAGLQHALTQVLRIALDETPDIEEATPGLKALLTRAAGEGSFAATQMRLAQVQTQTRDIFNRLLAAR
ncbi:MAG: FAD-dependent oxidoreductase [Planctomycetota bacterium]